MRLLTIGILATALLVGCSKDKKAGTESKPGHDHSMHAGHDHGMGQMATGDKVAVPRDGKKFKPPIKAAHLPDGAWYCDMGTVHYARGAKGDGKCPLCHMKLKQKVASN